MRSLHRSSLLVQSIAANAALVGVALLAAGAATDLDLERAWDRGRFAVLLAAILATVLVNAMVLRRRFRPLEALIDAIEGVESASGTLADAPPGEAEEVLRLRRAFRAMLGRLEAERAAGAAAVVHAQERERTRIARELHDECNQALTGLLLRLEAAALDVPPWVAAELRDCQTLASGAMEELLRLARELRPAALDELGLSAAVHSVLARTADRAGWEVELDVDDAADVALDADAQLAAYRCVQEALANAARHAGASWVRVEVSAGGVRVHDDGRGFDLAAPRGGLGLRGMRERAQLAGGRLEVRSARGEGTTVELALP